MARADWWVICTDMPDDGPVVKEYGPYPEQRAHQSAGDADGYCSGTHAVEHRPTTKKENAR